MPTAQEVLRELASDPDFQRLSESEQDSLAETALAQLVSSDSQSEMPSSGPNLPSEPTLPISERPATLSERITAGLLTEADRAKYLEGTRPEPGIPGINPSRLVQTLQALPALGAYQIPAALAASSLDLPELTADLGEGLVRNLPLAGQTALGIPAAAGGSVLGPVGSAAAAGGAGALGSRLVRQGELGLGRILTGLPGEGTPADLTRATLEGSMEALGPLAKPAGEITGKLLSKFSMREQPFIRGIWSKVLAATSGVRKESVDRLLSRGASRVVNNKTLEVDALPKFAWKVHNAWQKIVEKEGEKFRKAIGYIRADQTSTVDVSTVRSVVEDRLAAAGMMNPATKELLPARTVPTPAENRLVKLYKKLVPEASQVEKLSKDLPPHVLAQVKGQLRFQTENRLSYQQAFDILDSVDNIFKNVKAGRFVINSQEESALYAMKSELRQVLGNPKLGGSAAYDKAAKAFQPYLDLRQKLGGSLAESKAAVSNLRALDTPQLTDLRNTLGSILDRMPGKAGQKLREELADLTVADEVRNITIRSFRAGIIERQIRGLAQIAGTTAATATMGPVAGAATLAASSPRLMEAAIAISQAAARAIENGARLSVETGLQAGRLRLLNKER